MRVNNAGLPSGWQIKKLGEICDFQNGYAFKSKTYKESGLPILRITNIQNEQVDSSNLVYFDRRDYKENFARFEVHKGDLLIAMSGATTGKLAVSKNETVYYLNQRVGKFLPKDGLLSTYLFHFLTTKVEESLMISAGAAQPNLSTEQINNFKVPFPCLVKQQRIVDTLNDTFNAIAGAKANAEQNLKNAKELFETYLQAVFQNKGFEWEKKSLGDIAIVKSGGTPSRAKKEYWDGSIAWYSSGELNSTYTIDPERHINELAVVNSNAKLFPKGSLLIGMYDTAALKMSIVDREAAFNQAIAGVMPNDRIDLLFVLHSINSIKPELLHLRRGVRQKNLSLEKIKNIPIFLPTLKLQQTTVKKLDALSEETRKLEAIYKQKISYLDELKKSILEKAFKGELKSLKEVVV